MQTTFWRSALLFHFLIPFHLFMIPEDMFHVGRALWVVVIYISRIAFAGTIMKTGVILLCLVAAASAAPVGFFGQDKATGQAGAGVSTGSQISPGGITHITQHSASAGVRWAQIFQTFVPLCIILNFDWHRYVLLICFIHGMCDWSQVLLVYLSSVGIEWLLLVFVVKLGYESLHRFLKNMAISLSR